jgi:tetratricopeptide (TPR) repeat protein
LEYEKLLEKHSSEVKLYLDYIKVLEKLSVDNRNYLNKILETWEKLSNHFPNDPNVTLGLGKTYASFMKYQEAIQFIEMAVQLKPNLWEAYYELGLLYLAIGNPNRAFSFLSRIRERRKEFPHVEDIIKQIRLILKKDI